MKTILSVYILLLSALMPPANLPSGVFHWASAKATATPTGESRQMVNGSTTDLAAFTVHTSTLAPGATNHPLRAHDDLEELIVVKEGRLALVVGNQTKSIGPGGLALIIAGDQQSFQNKSGAPVTYYVLSYKSRKPVNLARGQQGGGSLVKDWTEFPVKKTEKGESRQVFDQPSSMFGRFDVHATSLDPGFASHDPHHHLAEEVILLLKGHVQMQIGQSFYDASGGDLVFLASDDLHALKNTGREQCSYFAIQWHDTKD